MKLLNLAIVLAAAMATTAAAAAAEPRSLEQGAVWTDTDGRQINAHGAGIMRHDGRYYLYGEAYDEPGRPTLGVNCYSSDNLTDWRYEGLALAADTVAGSPIERGAIFERPKVIFNPRTGKFVMWFHNELKGRGYEAAQAAVAVADSPAGPFRLLRSGRVNPGISAMGMPSTAPQFNDSAKGWSPEWVEAVKEGMIYYRDLPGGQMARDMTLFVDPDTGKAYHIYSSEENLTIQIAELDDDFTSHTGRYARVLPTGHNEAPAIFKRDGRFWMITSGCTGWAPNEARLSTATDIMGPWTQLPNPCTGPEADTTFGAQSTFVITPDDRQGEYILMLDRWRPGELRDSRMVWLPIVFDADGTPSVPWNPTFTAPAAGDGCGDGN